MAEDLWKLRQRKGMTVQQLAAKSGVPVAVIQEYEAGKRPIRSADLPKLARALFVEEWDIKDLSEPPPPARPAQPPPPPARTAAPPARPTPAVEPAPEQPTPTPAGRPAAAPARPVAPVAHPPAEQPAPPERPAKARKPTAPPAPARPTQITHLLGLAGKLGQDRAALETEIGKPVDQLSFQEARRWLGEYQRRLRERRAAMAQTAAPPAPSTETRHRAHLPESVDGFEAAYLTRHQQAGTRLWFKLFNGETFEGHLIGFGPYNIVIRQDDGTEVNLQKLAIAYYRSVATPEQERERSETGEAPGPEEGSSWTADDRRKDGGN